MAVKCTECGASIQDDSKFCKYCGAKVVQEDLKRVEIKIDNSAEIKRAEYEEKESELRQKIMKRELRMKGLKWKICGVIFLIGLIMALPGLINPQKVATATEILGMFLSLGVLGFIVIDWGSKLFNK